MALAALLPLRADAQVPVETLAAGQREEAIRFYRKSLELNPANTNAVQMLKDLDAEP